MTDDLSAWWVHTVSVARYTGSGAYGDVFATATTATGFVDDSRQLVRDVSGQEVVSSARVFLPAATVDIPLDSQVSLPAQFGGRTSRVIAVARHDAGGLPTPDHLEVSLR